MHKSGYINIVGHPNVGKSTLMNALLGEKMSIINAKPQTTRHRILGIYNDEDYQIIFSDSPGIIKKPSYKMQESMNRFAHSSFEDADVLLFMVVKDDKYEDDDHIFDQINRCRGHKILVVNKIDVSNQEEVKAILKVYESQVIFDHVVAISALEGFGVDTLLSYIKEVLPVGLAYYPKDQITDKPERFFVSEIIRESILSLYHQEIPYSCEVVVDTFKEKNDLLSIRAEIIVNRQSQKSILIGSQGKMIKSLGIRSRKGLEEFFQMKIYLDLYVKVKEDWRNDQKMLKNFGYNQ